VSSGARASSRMSLMRVRPVRLPGNTYDRIRGVPLADISALGAVNDGRGFRQLAPIHEHHGDIAPYRQALGAIRRFSDRLDLNHLLVGKGVDSEPPEPEIRFIIICNRTG